MPIIRAVARPLLAATFIMGGIDALRRSKAKVPAADKVVGPLTQGGAPMSTQQMVLADAAVKVLAGSTLALGKAPRLSSVALAASLVPTTVAGHRFWEEQDPAQRAQQRLHFVKNASILGGLILAAVDTEGKPSLAWRARRTSRSVKRRAAEKLQAADSHRPELHRPELHRPELHRPELPALDIHLPDLRARQAGDAIKSVAENLRSSASDVVHDVQPQLEAGLSKLRGTTADLRSKAAALG